MYDDWAGYIESERAITLMADIAREEGVAAVEETPVTAVEDSAGGATAMTQGGKREFDRIVVACGVWSGKLLPEVGKHLLVTLREMVLIEGGPAGGVFARTISLYGRTTRTCPAGTASRCCERDGSRLRWRELGRLSIRTSTGQGRRSL